MTRFCFNHFSVVSNSTMKEFHTWCDIVTSYDAIDLDEYWVRGWWHHVINITNIGSWVVRFWRIRMRTAIPHNKFKNNILKQLPHLPGAKGISSLWYKHSIDDLSRLFSYCASTIYFTATLWDVDVIAWNTLMASVWQIVANCFLVFLWNEKKNHQMTC